MKDKFVTAKIVKLPWIDQFIFLPGALSGHPKPAICGHLKTGH
jgi:hypothetical protein